MCSTSSGNIHTPSFPPMPAAFPPTAYAIIAASYVVVMLLLLLLLLVLVLRKACLERFDSQYLYVLLLGSVVYHSDSLSMRTPQPAFAV